MRKAHAKAQRRGDKTSEDSDFRGFAVSREDSHTEDWPTAQLQDVCSFVSGGTPSKQKPEFWIGSIPWVSPKDMKKPRLRDVVDHISDAALEDGSSLAPAGSIFIVIRGMILAKDVPVALAEVPMAFNQDMKAIIPGSRVTPSFLLYALVAFKRGLFQKVGRSAHGTMTLMTHDLAQFTFPVPPLAEQRRIAGVLGLVQRAVEQQERLLALVTELKETLVHHLFTHGLRSEPQKPTDLGPLPQSWDVVTLKEVCTLLSGGTPSKQRPDFWTGTIPWVSPKDMKKPRLSNVTDHISDEALADGSALAPAGSVFVVIRGMILAKDVPVALAEVPMAFNQDMKAVIPGSKVDRSFLLYALVAFKQNLFRKVGRSAHGTMTLMTSEIANFLLPLPDLRTQHAIADAIETVERNHQIHQRKHAALMSLFRTLLHQLMTARLRVADLDVESLLAQAVPEPNPAPT